MTTAGDLVDEIDAQLHGWGQTQDRVTPLANALGPTDATLTVTQAFGQAVGISPGPIQIDSEQLYVTDIDQNSGVATLAPGFGRGYSGTVAIAHAAGARVISRPKFPRVDIFKQLNEVVGSLYPDLFAVNTYSTAVSYPSNQYTIPGMAGKNYWALAVQWQTPIGNWLNLNSYTIDPFDGTFRLGGGAMIGRPLRVVYATEPVGFTSEADDFSVTGLPASCADLLQMGVVARQAPGLDISRAQLNSVEQQARSTVVPANAGITISKYLMNLYLTRLANERASLRRFYRPTVRTVF